MKVVDFKRLEGAMPCCQGWGGFYFLLKKEDKKVRSEGWGFLLEGGGGSRLKNKKEKGDGDF